MGNVSDTVTISRNEYDSLIVIKDKITVLKNMIVQGELESWEQMLLLLGDVDSYMKYCAAKEY